MLELLSDGQVHTLPEATDYLAKRFGLTESEKDERVLSGVQTRLQNRVGWARTDLRGTGLLEYIYCAGVTTEATYELKGVDASCFEGG